MAVINAGWLTDFKDIKFAPKTLFSQVYVDNPETGNITDLNSYFTTFLQKLNDKDLQVDLTSNSSVKFKNPGAIGVTGILDVPNGGTGLDTVTQHALLIGNETSALTLLPSAAGFLVSKQNGTAPLYSGIKGSWANLNSQTEGPTFYISFDGDAEATRYNMGKIPLANESTAGVVSTSAQTFSGGKTFAETAAFNKNVGIAGTLDVATGATIAQGLIITNGYISGILTPTANDHAANKAYVDAVQTNLNNLSNNIIGGTNTSGQTHHTRLNNLETRMTEAEDDFDTLTTYLGGYTDESTKAFFILDKDNKAIAYFNEKGLTVTEVYLDGINNTYKNISLSSYFQKVDSLEVHQGVIYSILGETSVASGKDHKNRLDGHDTAIATINDLNLQVALSSDSSVKVKSVNNNIGVDGILPVKHGGTGLDTLPQYDLMYGDDTNAVKFIAHDTTDTNGVKFLVNNPNAAPSYKTLGVNYTAGTEVGATYNIQIGGNDTGANFSLPAATVGQSGVVTTTEQTFSGKKIFSGKVAINGSTTIAALLTASSGIDVNNSTIQNISGMTYSDAKEFYFIDKNDNVIAYIGDNGINSINFISKKNDGTTIYDMNTEFASVNNKIITNYNTLDAAIKQEVADRDNAVKAEAQARTSADNNIYSILGETTLSTDHKTRLDNLVDLLGEATKDNTNGTHKKQLENLRTADATINNTALYVALGSADKTKKFSGGVIGVDGILNIANGGTGTGTAPTQWGIIYAASTSAYASTGAGTAGQVLMSNGTKAPSWHTPTSTNTANAIVQRDASGNFSANTITLSGRTPAINFNTSSYNYLLAPADGMIALCCAESNSLAGSSLIATSSSVHPGANNVFDLGTSSYKWANVYATTFNGALSGNASTASKWAAKCTIKLDGDASGNVSFDGSEGSTGVTLTVAVANNSHTHTWSNISDRATCSIDTTGTIKGSAVYGAVWNDYAEYRMQTEAVKPGYCVVSNNNGQVSKTTRRYQACDGIVSDTFGFAIGETDKCKTPLAVAGRVLAYCEGDRYNYQAGDTVCAGPDGKVCKMTREEIQMWPDRIVGIVSEIPEYETWGTGNVKVNGRIWIKIK